MNRPRLPHCLLTLILCVLTSPAILPMTAFGQMAVRTTTKKRSPGNVDMRLNGPVAPVTIAGRTTEQMQGAAAASSALVAKGIGALRAKVPAAEVSLSAVTGAVEVVHGAGPLTAAAPGVPASDVVRGFVQENRALYGLSEADTANLNYLGESVSEASGLRMVRVEQTVKGRPVFQSETRFTVDRDGRLVRSVGLMIPNAGTAAAPLDALISAPAALEAALKAVGIAADATKMTLSGTSVDGSETDIEAQQNEVQGKVRSRLVYFPIAPGALVPAWSQVAFTNGKQDWYTLVDARSGTVLWRKNIRAHASTQEARFSVYVQADGKTPADSPSPLSPTTATIGSNAQPPISPRTIVKMSTVQNLTASPNGWISDGGTTTNGNNVNAYLDREGGANDDLPDTDAASVLDGNGRPTGNPDAASRNRDFLGTSPRDFTLNPPPVGGNPEGGQSATGNGSSGTTPIDAFRRGAVTQLFYLANWYHDRLYALGFDEAAGNFQINNFGKGGSGGDNVLAEAQDNSDTDNANFSTPPDGSSGRMQLYRFVGPTTDRDCDLDAEIVLHELTHGLSNRLIGNGSGLAWDVGAGMGEGWSDFYALSLLNNTNADDPNGRYATAAYSTFKLDPGYTDNYVYGIRRFPYTTDNSINPLTWADVDDTTNDLSGGIPPSPDDSNRFGALEAHNVGEVWMVSLWEARSRVIADPAGANGDVPTGNNRMLQIVTDALKMTPINPSFADARDAVLDADLATNAGANEDSIWAGFADRGLGYNAVAPVSRAYGVNTGHVGIGESFSVPYLDVQAVTIDDSIGNNNGAIDPGEPVRLTVKLKNPWRRASKGVASATAVLTSSTPGVAIVDGNSTYPAIPALGSANGDTFQIVAPVGATAGQALKFTITPTSTLGSHPVDFVVRVGKPNGVGAPITYTRTITGGMAIPDDSSRGVVDTLTINDDFEIANLKFRVNSLTHPFVGDLALMLKAPNGYGTDLINLIGYNTDGGSGANLTNMVIDDSASADMAAASGSSAPYTGSWRPVFNSPSLNSPIGPIDPVGSMSRYLGLSTKGGWKLLVSDQGAGDTGKLNSWSMIVTPRVYSVTPFVTGAVVTGTETVAGSFKPGSNVFYTIILTNKGSAAQADNAGDEFAEVLPASLTLVSANATAGTAVATVGTNTVTWNGALAANGGTVTITVTATVSAGTEGQTISSQGTISYDADSDGTNETSAVTDDPGAPGNGNSTDFSVPAPAHPGGPVVAFAIGGVVPGEPIGTTFVSFGIPSLDGPNPGFRARIQPSHGGRIDVIVGGSPTGVLVHAADPAPGVTGAEFSSFKDPVFGGGHFAFQGTTNNPRVTGLWSDAFGSLRLLAGAGAPAPGVTGGKFQTFLSLALPPAGGAVFVAKVAGVPQSSNLGLWRETNSTDTTLLLRTGDMLAVDAGLPREVKSFAVLTAVHGSPADARYESAGTLVVRVNFTDKTEGIVAYPGDGSAPVVEVLTGDMPVEPADATFATFGFPAAGDAARAFNGTLQPSASISRAQDAGIFAGSGGKFTAMVREGDAAPGTGSVFQKFQDPVIAGPGRLAFIGTTRKSTGLWSTAFGPVELVASNGGSVPDVPKAHFAAITSFALPDGAQVRGPVFAATLKPGGGGVGITNAQGLWATFTNDETHLLVRTGDSVPVNGLSRKVKIITALGVVSGSPGQGRALNTTGQLIYRLTLNGGQAICTSQIP